MLNIFKKILAKEKSIVVKHSSFDNYFVGNPNDTDFNDKLNEFIKSHYPEEKIDKIDFIWNYIFFYSCIYDKKA